MRGSRVKTLPPFFWPEIVRRGTGVMAGALVRPSADPYDWLFGCLISGRFSQSRDMVRDGLFCEPFPFPLYIGLGTVRVFRPNPSE